MGFVHRFKQQQTVTPANWGRFQAELKTVFDHLPPYSLSSGGLYKEEPIKIADGRGQQQLRSAAELFVKPSNAGVPQALIFNGLEADDMDYEAFNLTRRMSDQQRTFCKTGRKPYDFLVIASLILINERAPGAFEIETDGDLMGWSPVGSWLARVLKRDVRLPDSVTGSDVLKGGCFSYVLESASPSFYDGVEVVKRKLFDTGPIIHSACIEDAWF